MIRWGEPRLTQDVDVSLLTGFGLEENYIDPLLAQFEPRIADAAAFALQHRVLLLTTSQGVDADIALAAVQFEEQLMERSSLFEFAPGCRLRTCSADDLVVL